MKSLFTLGFVICLVSIFSACRKNDRNIVPTADAGPSQSIQLPIDSIFLSGTGIDPDGKVVGYLWSKVSGPAAAFIVNDGAKSTIVKGLDTGLYVFQLMVTDNLGATGVDTVSVSVKGVNTFSIVIQPFNNPDEVSFAGNAFDNYTNPITPELAAATWTRGGLQDILRGVFKFDFSGIPANAKIKSAKLTLYSNPTPQNGNLIDANYGSNNTMLIQRISSSWDKNSTWQNQPSVDTANQIEIPHTSQSLLDLVDVDVTNLVKSMYQLTNYGFRIRLNTEMEYNSRIFCSSRYGDKTKLPKLVVVYETQ